MSSEHVGDSAIDARVERPIINRPAMTAEMEFGSLWRRWDLHVHAPSTTMANEFEGVDEDDKWERYISALEAAGEYGCLGVTDYFSLQGYYRVADYKAKGRLPNVGLILPNLELRIVPVTEKNKAINMHVLIDPNEVDAASERLLASLEMTYEQNKYNGTRNSLIQLGRTIAKGQTLTDDAAFKLAVAKFKVSVDHVFAAFADNSQLRRSALVAVANSNTDGNSGIQDDGLAALRREIYRFSDLIFSGNPKDRDYFLGLGRDSAEHIAREFGSLKPCVHGSDAHALPQIGNPALGRHTWIKADPSFEGLRQICHQPMNRVWIGQHQPVEPVHRIKRMRLSFPAETSIRFGGEDHPFCYRGETTVHFASGLTCLIGGRGAGKSTLLHLLNEKINPESAGHFDEAPPRANGSQVDIASCVDVEYVGDMTGVEFISQGMVEAFARDSKALTRAILHRLHSIDQGRLRRVTEDLARKSSALHALRTLTSHRASLQRQIFDAVAQQTAFRTMIDSFSDAEYVNLSSQLNEAAQEASELLQDRRALARYIRDLEAATAEAEAADLRNSLASNAMRELAQHVRDGVATSRLRLDEKDPTARERELVDTLSTLAASLEDFLEVRGLSAANRKDLADANQKLAALELTRVQQERDLDSLNVQIRELKYDAFDRSDYEKLLREHLATVNQQFASVHADVRKIELTYRFDFEMADDKVVDYVLGRLELMLGKRGIRTDHVKSELSQAGAPLIEVPLDNIRDAVRNSDNKTATLLEQLFDDLPESELFEYQRQLIKLDVQEFTRLEVRYDGKPVDRGSFGQRCSAVLIVLLTLGNAPIIIDEPEAHLDSAIIANYLVDLILRTKSGRQIIFATHNANFVVNGDADLVNIVDMDGELASQVVRATIEDVSKRDRLLALEGGAQAFLQREGRYGLH